MRTSAAIPSRSNPPTSRHDDDCSYMAHPRQCISDDEREPERMAEALSSQAPQQLEEALQRRRESNKQRRGSLLSVKLGEHDEDGGANAGAGVRRSSKLSAVSGRSGGGMPCLSDFYLSESLLSKTEPRKVRPKHHEIDRVIPNLRDVSVSSCHPNIKAGHLYRAARPFSRSVNDVYETLVKTLKIRTIIDLRDDNLTHIAEEAESRLLVSSFYKITSMTSAMNKCRQDVDAAAANTNENHSQTNAYATPRATDQLNEPSTGQPPPHPTQSHRRHSDKGSSHETILFEALRVALPKFPQDVIRDLARDPYLRPLVNMIFESEKRRMVIINVLDSPAVKKKVLQTLAGSPYLPLMVLARAADKVTGITAYAPFCFCKYILADRNIEESYYEMLRSCGTNFGIALKTICVSPSPILFHCSLGKDRTGLLSMLILLILGVSESAIIFDYTLTSQANEEYQSYNKKFIVELSGLSEPFCESNAETMRCVLNHIRLSWGTVDAYLDSIDFTKKWRDCLRFRFLTPDDDASTDNGSKTRADGGHSRAEDSSSGSGGGHHDNDDHHHHHPHHPHSHRHDRHRLSHDHHSHRRHSHRPSQCDTDQ